MQTDRRSLIAACLAAAIAPGRARAAARPVVRVGVLTDLSGPYADIAGQGSIACARLAAREFAANAQPGFDIDVISADHRNDPVRGAQIASDWFGSGGVDLIVDVPDSDVALAVAGVARAKNRAVIVCGAGTPLLTGGGCSPNTVHWSFDTVMLARSTGGAVARQGGSTWFFVTADYDFGHRMQEETTRFVTAGGGRVEGVAAYKFPGTTDFRPQLRQAQASGAAVLGLANAGADLIACVRQAHEAGIADQMRIAGLLMLLPDVHRLGLPLAGGSLLTESFYWDSNDRTRGFTQRLMTQEKPPFYPDMIHAGCYAGTLHFLKALAAAGVVAGRRDFAALVARMKATPTDDDAFGPCTIRRDGRVMVPALLFQVKTPEESTGAWDFYRLLSATPAEQAFRVLAAGECGLR